MLARGPWQFEKALICLAEPVGIGEVTKHVFTHVSFWAQILDVPILCMDTETIWNWEKLSEVLKRLPHML